MVYIYFLGLMGNKFQSQGKIQEQPKQKQQPIVQSPFKIICVGSYETKKSALFYHYVHKTHKKQKVEKYELNLYSIDQKRIFLDSPEMLFANVPQVKIQLWDIPSELRFRSILKKYFQNTGCVVLVYSFEVEDSIDVLKNYWLPVVGQQLPGKKYQLVLMGNINNGQMHDQKKSAKVREYAKKFAQQIGVLFSFEIDFDDLGEVERVMNFVLMEMVSRTLPVKLPVRQLSFRDIFMSFLIHFNEDFDDDLLQDAVELLTK